MKKVKKYIGKAVKKRRPVKYLRKAWEEILEEAEDFFDDFYEDIFKKRKAKKQLRKVKFYGTDALVRPAYVFAERVENFLKIIFGISIFISGILATFVGFTRTSELLEILIKSTIGRILIVIIGFSYFILGLWKVLHLHK